MKAALSTILLLACLSFVSCQKCKDCTLTRSFTVSGLGNQTTTSVQEYCGSTLNDIEENTTYNRDDVAYEWVCE